MPRISYCIDSTKLVGGMDENPAVSVVSALMSFTEPVGISKVAKVAHLPVQNADYWLGKLVEYGVVLCDDSGETKLYFLQPVFYDPNFATHFDKQFTQLYNFVKSRVKFPQGKDVNEVALFTLLYIFHVIMRESFKKNFK